MTVLSRVLGSNYRRGVWIGIIEHIQLLITIQYGTIAVSHILQFTRAHTYSSRSAVSSPVLWYLLPTADVPLWVSELSP